jgi:glycosyltransferase involved in cell wall biosynthesis
MKIAFDVTALYVAQGGIFYYDYNLARALLEHATEHELLFIDYYPIHGGWIDPPELRVLEDAEILRHVKGLRHRKLSRLHFLQHPILSPVAKWIDRTLFKPWALAADRVQKRRLTPVLEGVDVFHSSEVLLWKQLGALNVTTIYDLSALLFPEYHTDQTREIQAQKYRFACEEADVVVTISQATKRDIVKHLGIPAERIHVVYPGFEDIFHPIQDRKELQTMLAPLGLTPGDYLLHVGTLEPRKNLLRLVEAYHRVRHNLSVPIPKLVLAGAPGWDFRRIFELIEGLDLEDDVRYVGRVSRTTLPFLYSGARLFVYPSLYEGFGLPPLEAMACGTPVITSNVSSLPEVVGEAGLMVPPTDIDALVEALMELLSDSERREQLREAGISRARQFSWDKAVGKLLDVYVSESRRI